jgi:hypothetical protein
VQSHAHSILAHALVGHAQCGPDPFRDAEPFADRRATLGAKPGRKEKLDGLANEFCLGVAEQMNDMGIRKPDAPGLIDHKNGERQALQHRDRNVEFHCGQQEGIML